MLPPIYMANIYPSFMTQSRPFLISHFLLWALIYSLFLALKMKVLQSPDQKNNGRRPGWGRSFLQRQNHKFQDQQVFPRLATVRMVLTSVSIRICNNQYIRQVLQYIFPSSGNSWWTSMVCCEWAWGGEGKPICLRSHHWASSLLHCKPHGGLALYCLLMCYFICKPNGPLVKDSKQGLQGRTQE